MIRRATILTALVVLALPVGAQVSRLTSAPPEPNASPSSALHAAASDGCSKHFCPMRARHALETASRESAPPACHSDAELEDWKKQIARTGR